ncbi:hypothetical protein [Chromobacterium violaceum]|uniref:hypothetical protein n=1 Tax=Chromobacterium violaceum TaxID=536 RepID=UPI000B011B47|nr:hypothetical protein [Chromobacterium violaceum]
MENCGAGCIAAGLALQQKNVNFKTNDSDVGKSFVSLKVGMGRPLTKGEIEMCLPIFKDSIVYDQVRIVNAIHESQLNSTPPGVITDPAKPFIFFPPESKKRPVNYFHYQNDFSTPTYTGNYAIYVKNLFVHEMTHIWQRMQWRYYDLRTPNKAESDPKAWTFNKATKKWKFNSYYVPWDKDEEPKLFSQHNHEQQAEVVASYFAMTQLGVDPGAKRRNYVLKVLSNFLKDPKNINLLPFNADMIFGMRMRREE